MRILGVDPGLATTGIGLIERRATHAMKAIDWLTIETSKGLPLEQRLLELATDLEALLSEHAPDLAVVEELFFSTNRKTAMDVSQARGVILSTIAARGIPVVKATPLQLKTAITGDGAADKRQMQKMVAGILKLSEIPSPADAADALALAMFGALQHR